MKYEQNIDVATTKSLVKYWLKFPLIRTNKRLFFGVKLVLKVGTVPGDFLGTVLED